MKSRNKSKKPFVLVDRPETIRKRMISALEGQTLSVKNISGAVRISEKEVYDHIYHIQKTLSKKKFKLIIIPAECTRGSG